MCYPLHKHLFISEMFQADVEVLGPERSFFSMPLRAEPFSESWLNFFRKERGCLKSVFSCEAGGTRIAWVTTVRTDTVPSEKLPWQSLPYFCGCFSTFQDTRRSFHRSIRPHTTDGTSRTPCACHVQVSCPAVKRLSKLLLSPPKILWQHHTQSHRTDVLGMTVAKRLGNKEKGSWNLLWRMWRKSLSSTIHIPAFSSFFVWQIVFYLQPALFNAFSLPQPTGFLFYPSDNVTIWFYYSEIPKHVLQQSWKIIRCCCGVKAHLWSMAPSGNYGIKCPKTFFYLSTFPPPFSVPPCSPESVTIKEKSLCQQLF